MINGNLLVKDKQLLSEMYAIIFIPYSFLIKSYNQTTFVLINWIFWSSKSIFQLILRVHKCYDYFTFIQSIMHCWYLIRGHSTFVHFFVLFVYFCTSNTILFATLLNSIYKIMLMIYLTALWIGVTVMVLMLVSC